MWKKKAVRIHEIWKEGFNGEGNIVEPISKAFPLMTDLDKRDEKVSISKIITETSIAKPNDSRSWGILISILETATI
jgi:hypothetical protein